jgi:hypothetical protein
LIPLSLGEEVSVAVKGYVDRFFDLLKDTLTYVLARLLELVVVVARASYVTVGLIGLFLWLTHISPYRGRGMVFGAIIMAVVSEVAARVLLAR